MTRVARAMCGRVARSRLGGASTKISIHRALYLPIHPLHPHLQSTSIRISHRPRAPMPSPSCGDLLAGVSMADCDHDPASHTDTEWACTALRGVLLPAIGLSRVSQGQASSRVCLPACYLRNVWHGCPGRRRGDSEATVTITLVRRESSFPPARLRPGWTGVISISQSVRVGARTYTIAWASA